MEQSANVSHAPLVTADFPYPWSATPTTKSWHRHASEDREEVRARDRPHRGVCFGLALHLELRDRTNRGARTQEMAATATEHQTLSAADYGNEYIGDTWLEGPSGMALNSLPRVSASSEDLDRHTLHKEAPSRQMEQELGPSHCVRSDCSRCTNPCLSPIAGHRPA